MKSPRSSRANFFFLFVVGRWGVIRHGRKWIHATATTDADITTAAAAATGSQFHVDDHRALLAGGVVVGDGGLGRRHLQPNSPPHVPNQSSQTLASGNATKSLRIQPKSIIAGLCFQSFTRLHRKMLRSDLCISCLLSEVRTTERSRAFIRPLNEQEGGSMGNPSENQPYVSDFGHTLHRGSP